MSSIQCGQDKLRDWENLEFCIKALGFHYIFMSKMMRGLLSCVGRVSMVEIVRHALFDGVGWSNIVWMNERDGVLFLHTNDIVIWRIGSRDGVFCCSKEGWSLYRMEERCGHFGKEEG